jgi:hypothetical protein
MMHYDYKRLRVDTAIHGDSSINGHCRSHADISGLMLWQKSDCVRTATNWTVFLQLGLLRGSKTYPTYSE